MMFEPLMKNFSTPLKIFSFVFIIILSLLFTMLLGILIAVPFFGADIIKNLSDLTNYNDPDTLSLLKYLQIINQLGIFIFPPIIFAFLVNKNIPEYLKLSQKPGVYSSVAVILLMFLAFPLINRMVEINESLKLPEFLAGIEKWMKESEEHANRLTEAFINDKTLAGFIINLLMIAFIPAIGEEFVFRGVLLRLLKEWMKNVHLAILFSAILFSALHLQFYGFFPRMMLGILFGYLFIWTGTLWVPVIAHFIINVTAVITVFMANRGIIDSKFEAFSSTDNKLILALSLIIVVLILFSIYSKTKKKEEIPN
ncbi:MAG: CPBP family intramembrane metalloprotease [Bacteroidales bacterium]|nr:CPBP family intramembrane metalloprotease [Bacteroidales bacterium]